MAVNKLERFAEIAEFNHVLEYTDYQDPKYQKPKGHWRDDIFGNAKPIILELACGTAAYSLALAQRYKDRNFVGLDIKGARLWKGAKKAKEEQIENVRFLRIYIDHLDEYFASQEVNQIWITFPDPYPRASDRDKRLTSDKFLKIYQKVLAADGDIYLKTDDQDLFDYTLKSVEKFGGSVLESSRDIYKEYANDQFLTIKTKYEKKHLANGKEITFCRFRLPAE